MQLQLSYLISQTVFDVAETSTTNNVSLLFSPNFNEKLRSLEFVAGKY